MNLEFTTARIDRTIRNSATRIIIRPTILKFQDSSFPLTLSNNNLDYKRMLCERIIQSLASAATEE